MIRAAGETKNVTSAQPAGERALPIGRPHRMEKRPRVFAVFRTAVHRQHLDERRERRVERVPIDPARSGAVTYMMGLRDAVLSVVAKVLQLPVQIGEVVGIQNLAVQIFVEHVPVAGRTEVDLEAWKDHKFAFRVTRAQRLHHLRPDRFQTCETFFMIIDDVLNSLLWLGHVGPMRVTGDRHEIELLAGVRQCVFQRAVAVGNPAMIVNVAKKRP